MIMAVIIDTDFPGGGVEDVKIRNGRERGFDWIISFSAPLDGTLLGESLWFCFRIRGAAGKTLKLIQRGMDHTLGPFFQGTYAVVRPVIWEGGEGAYKRIPKEDTFFIHDPVSFTFDLIPQSNETYIAFCYPYQYADLLRFAKKYSNCLSLKFIGKTPEGRDYPVLICGDDGNPQKKLLVASARQHSGETPGSFVLEGFIESYFADNEDARRLREITVLVVLPLVNLDGVEMGRYGKNAPPEDFNRAWSAKTCRMEIRSFLDLLETLLQTYKSGFYADFHGPQPGGYSYVVPPQPGVTGRESWKKINLFIDLFEKLTHDRGYCRRKDLDPGYINWGGDNYRLTSKEMFIQSYGFEALTLETAYHEDCRGNSLNPGDWRFMGRQFCEAVRLIWFEAGDGSLPSEAAAEICRDGWETIGLPRNVKTSAKPGEFRVESEGGGAIVSFSDYRQIGIKEEGSYELSCEGESDLVLFVYYSIGGKTAARSRIHTIRLEHEKMLLPFSVFSKDTFDNFRMVFRVNSLEGILTINYGK
jgi:hypothetical protein